MGFLSEFREFALRGNVVDLAVGIIIGGAFSKVTNSMVNDIIMPPVGMLIGGVNFNNLYIPLDRNVYQSLAAAREAGAPVLAWGNFVTVIVDFTILAFSVFLVVKGINTIHKRFGDKKDAPPA